MPQNPRVGYLWWKQTIQIDPLGGQPRYRTVVVEAHISIGSAYLDSLFAQAALNAKGNYGTIDAILIGEVTLLKGQTISYEEF